MFETIRGSLPKKFQTYFDEPDVNGCLKKMLKEKKGGKILLKFFKTALKGDAWQNNTVFRSLLDGCVERIRKLDKKNQKQFQKYHTIFNEKVHAFESARPKAAPQPNEVPDAEDVPRANVKQAEHLKEIGTKVKDAQKIAFDRLVACFIKEKGIPASTANSNGVQTQEELKKATKLFNVSAANPLPKTYKLLLLVAHPDKWSTQSEVAETAASFVKFMQNYRDILNPPVAQAADPLDR